MREGPSGGEFSQSPLMRFLNAGRHFVPLAWRSRLRQLVFSLRPVTITRPSGIRLRIAGNTDWIHYTEIFRKGEYDSAIERALHMSDGAAPMTIVDLGANVGFFTLRAIELARTGGRPDASVKVVAFEASAGSVDEFRARVMDQGHPAANVRLVRGLVGERSGTAVFYEGASHGDSSLFTRETSRARGAEVPFVDVSAELAEEPVIHLLKCDIEGAELQFIRSFADVLGKARVAVFELHDNLCDTDECRRLLDGCGFPHRASIRRAGPYSLECRWR